MNPGTATITASRGVKLPGGTYGTVEIELPPSTNNLFATVKGRRVKSKEYTRWIKRNLPTVAQLRQPILPCRVVIGLFGKINGARDGDNFLKPIMDALVSAGVIPGDSLRYVVGCRWFLEPNYHTCAGVWFE